MTETKQMLLVGGVPRSGTTAFARLLRSHPKILIGVERYLALFLRGEIATRHFEKERFLSVREDDTHEIGRRQFQGKRIEARFDAATYIGDKIPPIYRWYDRIWAQFPKVQILYIFRNPISVAESYEARSNRPTGTWDRTHDDAVSEWNSSLAATLSALRQGRAILPVAYERLFAGRGGIVEIFRRLKLDPAEASDETIDKILERSRDLDGKLVPRRDDIRMEVARAADAETYRTLLDDHCLLRNRLEVAQ